MNCFFNTKLRSEKAGVPSSKLAAGLLNSKEKEAAKKVQSSRIANEDYDTETLDCGLGIARDPAADGGSCKHLDRLSRLF